MAQWFRVLVGIVFLAACAEVTPQGMVANFEDCLIAGGDIAESHPRQCTLNGKTISEDIAIGAKDERRVMRFQVAPKRVQCQGLFAREQACLVVNGELFYDPIEGYTHIHGQGAVLSVERHQYCDPKLINDCPQDVGIYRYRLLAVEG